MVIVEEIQPGWLVVDNFGEEIGTVASVSGQSFHVKLYGGGDIDLAGSDCALVETGRVELSKSRRDIQSR